MIGTLIWVGDTTAAEFRGAVEYCLVNISQLAFRRDMTEALARPASEVRWILIAQSNRRRVDHQRLLDRYPTAESLILRGPLCQGFKDGSGIPACDWQRWKEPLDRWTGNVIIEPTRCRTVAVVAATMANAEPLLDLAQSCGATPIWCRTAASQQLRNIDAVWWDDSVACPTSCEQWEARIEAFAVPGKRVQHAWIVQAPTYTQTQQARLGGVDGLVSKPDRIDALAAMLEPATQSSLAAVRAA